MFIENEYNRNFDLPSGGSSYNAGRSTPSNSKRNDEVSRTSNGVSNGGNNNNNTAATASGGGGLGSLVTKVNKGGELFPLSVSHSF